MLRQDDSGYIWPQPIVRPRGGPRLVYLDLNHWIGLAKAATGHRDGDQHREALDGVRRAASSGEVIFPLSGTHYMEMAGIRDPRQRADVAAVMEELSSFNTLLCRSVVMRLELEAALDAFSATEPRRYLPVALLGRGVGPAFGMPGGLRIRSPDGDITETTRLQWLDGPDQFDQWLFAAELQLERAVLRGPSDSEEPALAASGWDPTVARTIAERRAQQEREQKARFDAEPRWRRSRLRDVVSARYVIIELMDMFNEALAARGIELEDLWSDPTAARRFVGAMPSADVCVSLMTAAHRNRDKSWEPNDIFDIDALSVAVPYCDVVVTERHAHHVLQSAGVPTKVNTKVVATLVDLAAML